MSMHVIRSSASSGCVEVADVRSVVADLGQEHSKPRRTRAPAGCQRAPGLHGTARAAAVVDLPQPLPGSACPCRSGGRLTSASLHPEDRLAVGGSGRSSPCRVPAQSCQAWGCVETGVVVAHGLRCCASPPSMRATSGRNGSTNGTASPRPGSARRNARPTAPRPAGLTTRSRTEQATRRPVAFLRGINVEVLGGKADGGARHDICTRRPLVGAAPRPGRRSSG